MPIYIYKARNDIGEPIQGRTEASSKDAVAMQLNNSGIIPIEISEEKKPNDFLKSLKKSLGTRKPNLEDVIFFSRQLYTLMKAGVPIINALKGLSDNLTNQILIETIKDIIISLESGRDLSGALAKHPKIFNNLFVSMVQVGESTGRLDEGFLKLSQYLEREKQTRDSIKQAMRYPIIVITAILIAITVINVAVIPKFANIFAKFGADLPWQTKMLMAGSQFTINYWAHMLASLVLSIFSFRKWLETENGIKKWDHFKIRIPIIGTILYEALLARFATAFALTLKSGVPLIQSLTVVSYAVDNAFVGDKIRQMRSGVERGDSLTRTAASTKMFTPLTIQMLQVGEDSGSVDEMLENVAFYYDREVDFKLKNLSSAIEPILIIIVGAIVFLLALGVFLPLWELTSVIQK